MNMAYRWAAMLTSRDIEAIHWAEIGPGGAPDYEIMDYAKRKGYAVLTNDLDFGTALALTAASAPSVVQIRSADVRPEHLLEPVVNALAKFSTDIEQGALVTIDTNKIRIHILPFTRSIQPLPQEEG
jgi:predicted nuclease of predicted toxin-antitoxin system